MQSTNNSEEEEMRSMPELETQSLLYDEISKTDEEVTDLEKANQRIKQLEMELFIQKEMSDCKQRYELEMRNIMSKTNSIKLFPSTHLKDIPCVSTNNANISERHSSTFIDLPKRELKKFNGDPMKYCPFIRCFESSIENKFNDNELRLSFLIQLCEGDALKAIEYCSLLDPEDGYLNAKETLKKRFGRPPLIAKKYLDQLTDGPLIKVSEPNALMKLVEDMKSCDISLRYLNYCGQLNNPQTLSCIVRRLPNFLQYKWAEKCAKFMRKEREPSFSDLITFVEDLADVSITQQDMSLSETTFRKQMLKETDSNKMSRISTLSTQIQPAHTHLKPNVSRIPSCPKCKEFHYLDVCAMFLSLSPTLRLQFVNEHKLCHLCLKPNHDANLCRKPSYCTFVTCNEKHHTLLHKTEGNSINTNAQSIINQHALLKEKRVALAIVPVRVKGKYGAIETYAFLDNGSDSSLITESLAKKLNLDGEEQKLTINTLGNTVTRAARHLGFRAYSMDESRYVDVKGAWTVCALPKLGRLVPTERQLNVWKHLRDVKLMEIDDEEVNILIGCDVPEAHWTLDQRYGRAGEPFAVETILGWTVLGPIHELSNNNIVINSVLIEEDTLIKHIANICSEEFNERFECGLSIENKYALSIMESTVRLCNGHNKLSLPWKCDAPKLPNNKVIAERRLQLLRKRLIKNNTLYEHHFTAMMEYISKGFIEKVPSLIDKAEGYWYLPHHPVYHLLKPNKVRIVFDYANEFLGASLNKQLYSGPGKNNSLNGVLIRFREEYVTVIAEKEAMFHQVYVTESGRDYLRLLWLKNNINEPFTEYRMVSHPFGATSSPSCAIFALNKTIAEKGCDWIFNPPLASHRGGLWERMVRSLKKILRSLVESRLVNDEGLLTILAEVEKILNDRPLVKHYDDPDEFATITSNKLLLMRSNNAYETTAQRKEVRLNKVWIQAQQLVQNFWSKCMRDYLPTLQERQRWLRKVTNFKVGDLVLLTDGNKPRGMWSKAIVEEVKVGNDGLVREALVRTSDQKLRRDVRQLCLLEGVLEDAIAA